MLLGLSVLGLDRLAACTVSADGLASAGQAVDRMVESTEEVIREDLAAYLAQPAARAADEAMRPVGEADLALSGDHRGTHWRVLAFRTRDTACTLLVTGARDVGQSGCVGAQRPSSRAVRAAALRRPVCRNRG